MLIAKSSRAKRDVKETTEVLKMFGLSTSDNTTRRLIREGHLKATPAGEKPGDKRSGVVIYERDIYKFIVERIPVMKDYFALLEEKEQSKTKEVVKK